MADSTSQLEPGCGLGRRSLIQRSDTERHKNVPAFHLPPGVEGSCHPEGELLLSFPISEVVMKDRVPSTPCFFLVDIHLPISNSAVGLLDLKFGLV